MTNLENHLSEEIERLTNTLKVIRDFTGYGNSNEMQHINDVCIKTINKKAVYKPLSQ